jgi:hypothetical protein
MNAISQKEQHSSMGKIPVHQMWMKMTLGFNFINILRMRFSYESAFFPKSFCQSQNVTRKSCAIIFRTKNACVKC